MPAYSIHDMPLQPLFLQTPPRGRGSTIQHGHGEGRSPAAMLCFVRFTGPKEEAQSALLVWRLSQSRSGCGFRRCRGLRVAQDLACGRGGFLTGLLVFGHGHSLLPIAPQLDPARYSLVRMLALPTQQTERFP